MTWNVLASWAGHFVFIIAGFIMPRLIDRNIGHESLGVWDFAWSLVAYFGLAQSGLVSSVNRYVAKYRAAGDTAGINCVVSSATCVLSVLAVAVFALTVVVTIAVPSLLSSRLGEHMVDAQWVIFLLGVSLTIQMVLSGFGGVVTGCHRWDLHNAIHAGGYAVTVAGMISVIMLGGGLRGLALVTLCGDAMGRVVRTWFAYRVCPNLHVGVRYANWSTIRRLGVFGGKTLIPHVGSLLMLQTIAVLIVVYLGPGALALYARPRALIRHATSLVEKFAHVLTPTASSLQAMHDQQALSRLLIRATQISMCITLPLTLIFLLMGDYILLLWMGPAYQQHLVLAILAVGYFAWIIQLPVRDFLVGLNAHGRPGLANFFAGVCAAGMAFVTLGPLRWGLPGAALAVAIPLTIVNGVYVPIYVCRRLKISVWRYAYESARVPAFCSVPFALCLFGARMVFVDRPLAALIAGCVTGGCVLFLLYWRSVLPISLKKCVIARVTRGRPQPATQSP